MEVKTYSERELRKLMKKKPLDGSFNLYDVKGKVHKIDKDLMFDLQRKGYIVFNTSNVDIDQILWLTGLNDEVKKSSLPSGIIYYQGRAIGVIYPKNFIGYKSFLKLHQETPEIMFQNIRTATDNNIELMEHGIYNYDFTMGNILYNGSDVELIDLDGKYIRRHRDLDRVYLYYIDGIIKQFCSKIEENHSVSEQLKLIRELQSIVKSLPKQLTYDYPHVLVDKVEQSKILK